MKQEKIIAYKGLDKDFRCRGFQYEVGKEYEEEVVECYNKGFHACENPMDVWEYYNITDSRFAIVEQFGKIDKQDNKTCSSKIKIKAELKFADFVKLCVDAVIDKYKLNSKNDNGGDSARIGSSGDYARIGSSGYSAQIGSSGDYAQIGSSGDSAQIGSSGDYAQIKSEGQGAVIMCAGTNSKARAKKGSWITLAEYDDNRKPVCVKTEQVDGERIKEDTWYQLIDGEFKEVKL